MHFTFAMDIGLLIGNAIQGAVTGAATAAAVLIVTRPLKALIERDKKDGREDCER